MANITDYLVSVQKSDGSGWIKIPTDLIEYESYKANPHQMIDLDSYRSETGTLKRNVLDHSSTKLEFNLRRSTDDAFRQFWTILNRAFTSKKAHKLKVRYYDPYTDSYQTAVCYVPDVELTIRNVDFTNKTINYEPIRIAFIEY